MSKNASIEPVVADKRTEIWWQGVAKKTSDNMAVKQMGGRGDVKTNVVALETGSEHDSEKSRGGAFVWCRFSGY